MPEFATAIAGTDVCASTSINLKYRDEPDNSSENWTLQNQHIQRLPRGRQAGPGSSPHDSGVQLWCRLLSLPWLCKVENNVNFKLNNNLK